MYNLHAKAEEFCKGKEFGETGKLYSPSIKYNKSYNYRIFSPETWMKVCVEHII